MLILGNLQARREEPEVLSLSHCGLGAARRKSFELLKAGVPRDAHTVRAGGRLAARSVSAVHNQRVQTSQLKASLSCGVVVVFDCRTGRMSAQQTYWGIGISRRQSRNLFVCLTRHTRLKDSKHSSRGPQATVMMVLQFVSLRSPMDKLENGWRWRQCRHRAIPGANPFWYGRQGAHCCEMNARNARTWSSARALGKI